MIESVRGRGRPPKSATTPSLSEDVDDKKENISKKANGRTKLIVSVPMESKSELTPSKMNGKSAEKVAKSTPEKATVSTEKVRNQMV